MRVFISIDIPEKVKREIVKIQEKLPEFKGKKTEFENLHLTLKFLGEVDEEKIEKIREKLRKVNFKTFNAEIDSIGVFSKDFVRIIWLHLTNCDELQKEVDEKLGNLFEKEKRFMSHLTIARVKSVRNKKEFLDELKKIKILKMKFVVDKFELKESALMQRGPIYKTIEEYKLK